MDPRRGRPVIDPLIRQVGFVTPTSPRDAAGEQGNAPSEDHVHSPTPVFIPPPALKLPPGAPQEPPKGSVPIAVPAPSHFPPHEVEQAEPSASAKAAGLIFTDSPESADKGYNSVHSESILNDAEATSPPPPLLGGSSQALLDAGGKLPTTTTGGIIPDAVRSSSSASSASVINPQPYAQALEKAAPPLFSNPPLSGSKTSPSLSAPSVDGPAGALLSAEEGTAGKLPNDGAATGGDHKAEPGRAPADSQGAPPAAASKPPPQSIAKSSPAGSSSSTPASSVGRSGAPAAASTGSVRGGEQGGADSASKSGGGGGGGGGVKAKTTKAERRALQEAQRAAKASGASDGGAALLVFDYVAAAKGGAAKSKPAGSGKAQLASAGAAKKDTSSRSEQQQQHLAASDRRPSVSVAGAGGGGGGNSIDRKKGGGEGAAAGAVAGGPGAGGADKAEKKKESAPARRMQFDDANRVAKAKKRQLVDQTEPKNRVELFRHLAQYERGSQLPSLEAKFFSQEGTHPHPAVYQVGLQFLTGDIVGGNARCVAMLHALAQMITDYSTPPEKTLGRDLTAKINAQVSFLATCRPLAIGMGNAIRVLKQRIARLPDTCHEGEAKAALLAEAERFVQEKVVLAAHEIAAHGAQKIRAAGDVILTHGSSHVVETLLLSAHRKHRRKFRVVVVDSRPKLEGQQLLRRLLQAGIQCTYVNINAVSYEVTRVFLGASSVLANGTVYSRVGSASVAMVAHAHHVPVMICCETYKLSERVQLDSITSNELGDPDELARVRGREDKVALEGWQDNPNLQLLNLLYDVMPAEYVTMIITELGMASISTPP
eukprot:jgi/Mesen1/6116/ME000311S05212